MTNAPILSLKHVSKTYAEHGIRALDDVCLDIQSGDRVAILGASGSGKTTLLNIIATVDQPDSGEIVLSGYQLSNTSESQRADIRKNKIGFIFQFFNLLPTMTVAENIQLPLQLQAVLSFKEQKQQVAEMMDWVGLTDRKDFYAHQLSGGQMQRVAIARALIHRPQLIIADEPTGNLDSENGKLILDLIHRSCEHFNQTLLMATHSEYAASTCHRKIIITDGTATAHD